MGISITFRQALREGLFIAAVGCALGLMYTGVTGQGMFASRESSADRKSDADEPAPEFVEYNDALEFYRSGKAVFVDARHAFDYELGHISGAINLPLKEYDEKKGVLASFPKDALLVTYCDGQECNSSVEMALKLSAEGFSNVKIFFDGWREWESHHASTEKSSQ